MHLISGAVTILLVISCIKSTVADVLIYTQATNQVRFRHFRSLSIASRQGQLAITHKKSYSSPQIIEEFQSLAARFGPSLAPSGLRALAVGGEPYDGCAPMQEAPKSNYTFHGITPKFVVLVVRGTCSFAGECPWTFLISLAVPFDPPDFLHR